MSDRPAITYWLPLALGLGTLFLAVPLSNLSPGTRVWAIPAATALGVALIIVGALIAYRVRSKSSSRGARGGDATVRGSDSSAVGGAGASGNAGIGGRGGDAKVRGNRSSAIGGRGGRA